MTRSGCGSWRSRRAIRLEVARSAVAAGLTSLGENRVQEAEPKITALPEVGVAPRRPPPVEQGPARRARLRDDPLGRLVDLLRRRRRWQPKRSRQPALLLQVNVTGEPSKAGMSADGPSGGWHAVAAVREVRLIGLMTIAPMGASVEEARSVFGGLRELRDRLEQAAGIGLPELSMGMTADADVGRGGGSDPRADRDGAVRAARLERLTLVSSAPCRRSSSPSSRCWSPSSGCCSSRASC